MRRATRPWAPWAAWSSTRIRSASGWPRTTRASTRCTARRASSPASGKLLRSHVLDDGFRQDLPGVPVAFPRILALFRDAPRHVAQVEVRAADVRVNLVPGDRRGYA